MSTFQLDPETQGGQLRREANRYALWCFVIAILSTLAVIVQSWMYGDTAERLSAKIRLNTFKSTLRQDIAFFDRDENSTGTLTNSITDRATKVRSSRVFRGCAWGARQARRARKQKKDADPVECPGSVQIFGLFGQTQGVIIQSLFTLVAGAIIGLCYSWKIALVGIACMPLTLSAGIVRLRVVVLKDEKNKKSQYALSSIFRPVQRAELAGLQRAIGTDGVRGCGRDPDRRCPHARE